MVEQELERRKKLNNLRSSNQDPFSITSVECTSDIDSVQDYSDLPEEELVKKSVSLIGRIISIRQSFLVIRDNWKTLQLYISSNSPVSKYLDSYVDIGDFVFVSGSFFHTKTQTLTLRVSSLQIISKCLNPFPSQYYGIKDDELRSRNRVARALVEKEFWETLCLRSRIIFFIRKYLDNLGYLEIETPIFERIYGGANALPFVTHCASLNQNLYLRIATEISLKKAVVAGFSKVYELGRVFRNEGIDSSHNPEFTSLEVYSVNFDLQKNMDFVESLIVNVASELGISDTKFKSSSIFISKSFEKKSMSELVKKEVGIDFYNDQVTLDQALVLADKYKLQLRDFEKTVGHIFHKLFDELVVPKLINPVFVYGFHKDVSPLAKLDSNNSQFVDRYELYIGGEEFANGFSELNDPDDQKSRFEAQLEERKKGNVESLEIDEDYIFALKYGLPPTGGFGIGIDRLVMLLTQNSSIKDVLFFPLIKK